MQIPEVVVAAAINVSEGMPMSNNKSIVFLGNKLCVHA